MVNTRSFEENGKIKKKRAWSKDEDDKLRTYIRRYGHWNWRLLPKFAGLSRSGKSCRLRWVNYLRPDIKHGNFTKEEEDIIVDLHKKLGNKWSEMAAYLPGRSDNEIKNRWHSHLKKRVQNDQACILETQHVGTTNPDEVNRTQNPDQKTDLEFNKDFDVLLAESPLSSRDTRLSSCWLNGLDLVGSCEDTLKLDDYTSAGNFWTEIFLSDSDNIISSSNNLFLPSDLDHETSFKDMIMYEDFLWS